jgi:hypothetical protein
MRCLYCGKELALLKRLRGGGDFCSVAHKQSYQEEYNRLALSRLLQAQKKGQQANSPAENSESPPNALVALEEPVAEDAGPVAQSDAQVDVLDVRVDLQDDLQDDLQVDETSEAAAPPVLEVALTEALSPRLLEAAPDSEEVEESPTEAAAAETSLGAEPEPLELAGFLFDGPSLSAGPDSTPCLEPWLELSPGPAMSEWQVQNASFSLSSANLLSLDLRPKAAAVEHPAVSTSLSPQAIVGAQPEPALSSLASSKKIANKNRLPASNVIAVDIAPSSVASTADGSLAQAIGFESTVLFDDSQLLELLPTAIDFVAEDSGALVLAGTHHNDPAEPSAEDTPRASLEALSRLHQELVEQEAMRSEEASLAESRAEPREAAPVEIVNAVSVAVIAAPEAVPAERLEAQPKTVEIAAEAPEPEAEGLKLKFATELFELSIKTFQPAKPALIGGDAFPSQSAPLLPHLKALPLRPKVALAPDYVPPSKASAPTAAPSETKPAATAAPAARPQGGSKPGSGGKPAARLTQPKQPIPAAKPVQAAAAKAPEPRTPAAPQVVAPHAASPKAAAPKAEATKPVAKPVAMEPTPVQESAPKVVAAEREQAPKPEPAAQQPKPVVEQPKPVVEQSKPAAEQPKPASSQAKPKADQAKKDNVPNFGATQPANVGFLGSLKIKLGLAITLLVIACVYFLGWGGGKSKAGSSNAISADGSGPSIIMGEGGWVEGWGGDPSGIHTGRQITIYRPSLKLSDYRLEFQGSIDTKSVGWVFRASDPDNYYAMKLMTVSSGLSTKVALFKYLVANGKQTQVGRVPIDLAVQADTVFNIRLDVRGPQFTTYIQGQQVDSWTDDQLKIGGAGFLNEREERGKVKSVSIRYLSGAAK